MASLVVARRGELHGHSTASLDHVPGSEPLLVEAYRSMAPMSLKGHSGESDCFIQTSELLGSFRREVCGG